MNPANDWSMCTFLSIDARLFNRIPSPHLWTPPLPHRVANSVWLFPAMLLSMRAPKGGSAMSFSDIFARGVALVGAAAIQWRQLVQGGAQEPAWGSAPKIPTAKPQGSIPTLKMPTAKGWAPGHTPVAAPGLRVNAFAAGLKHPRWINVLPN